MITKHDLKKEIARLNDRIYILKNEIDYYENQYDEINKLRNTTPEDCKPGKWCEACVHSKTFRVSHSYVSPARVVRVCGKGGTCKNFAGLKTEEEK